MILAENFDNTSVRKINVLQQLEIGYFKYPDKESSFHDLRSGENFKSISRVVGIDNQNHTSHTFIFDDSEDGNTV